VKGYYLLGNSISPSISTHLDRLGHLFIFPIFPIDESITKEISHCLGEYSFNQPKTNRQIFTRNYTSVSNNNFISDNIFYITKKVDTFYT